MVENDMRTWIAHGVYSVKWQPTLHQDSPCSASTTKSTKNCKGHGVMFGDSPSFHIVFIWFIKYTTNKKTSHLHIFALVFV